MKTTSTVETDIEAKLFRVEHNTSETWRLFEAAAEWMHENQDIAPTAIEYNNAFLPDGEYVESLQLIGQ